MGYSDESFEEVEKWETRMRNVEEKNLDVNILCARCKWGKLMRRGGKLDYLVYCESFGRRVPSDIQECSEYRKKGSMELHEMQRIADIVDPRKGIDDRSYI